MIRIEQGEQRPPRQCPECHGEHFSSVGFVHDEQGALAIYRAEWAPSHPEHGAYLSIEFGNWGAADQDVTRFQVGLEAWSTDAEVRFRFTDPEESPWTGLPSAGPMLTRSEALANARKAEALHVAEHVVSEDVQLKAFLDNHRRAA